MLTRSMFGLNMHSHFITKLFNMQNTFKIVNNSSGVNTSFNSVILSILYWGKISKGREKYNFNNIISTLNKFRPATK